MINKKLLLKLKKHKFPLHCFIIYNKIQYFFAKKFSSLFIKWYLSLWDCQVGKGFIANGFCIIRISKKASITIGNRVIVNSDEKSNLVGKTNKTIFHCIDNGTIKIGDNSGCSFSVISSMNKIEIGKNVKIGGNVRIFDHDYHSINYLHRRNRLSDRLNCKSKEIIIHDDVFIGTNSMILKGVIIGEKSIIGAGSVVTKTVPPGEIWAGNPAKFVKRIEES